jgi:hypothetical protein
MKTTCKLMITRRAAVVTLASATATMAWACARPKDHAAGSADSASATTAQTAAQTVAINADADDPCRYVTAEEAQPYVGLLVAPPYRVTSDNGLPNPTGDGCLYRGRDGREITVQYLPHGGQMGGTVARRIPTVMDRLLHNATGQAGSNEQGGGLASAVMGSAGPGPWDNSNWFPQGNLMAYKGDAVIMVDVAGADGGKDGAVDLGTKAVNRLSQPLDYNGAKAVALAPKPVHPVPACDLVPRDQAERVLGHLTADPQPDSAGTACTYQVASADGDVSYKMGIGWTQGYKGVNVMKHSMATMGPLLTGAGQTFSVGRRGMPGAVPGTMPDMPKLDSGQQKMLGAFTKALGMPAMGAAVSRGLKTDTTMAGPWDTAALVNGSWLMVSKDDVSLTIILGTADYDKAKALLAAACERL